MRPTLLLLSALLLGCASRPDVVITRRPTPPAERVRGELHRLDDERVLAVGLDDGERELEASYVHALGAGLVRHHHAASPERYAAERQAVRAAWEQLADHFRAALVEDLRHDRLHAFHLRAQELLPFARRACLEAELDALAAGQRELAWEFADLFTQLSSDTRAFPDERDRWTVEDVGLPGVFEREPHELLAHTQAFTFLARGLGQALFRLDAQGRPTADEALSGELLHQRARALARLDRPARAGAPAHAQRAAAAADEAEAHRDRSLDAALDASVAAERTRLGVDVR